MFWASKMGIQAGSGHFELTDLYKECVTVHYELGCSLSISQHQCLWPLLWSVTIPARSYLVREIFLHINTGTVFVRVSVCLPHARSRERKVVSLRFLHRPEEFRLASCTNRFSRRYDPPLGRKGFGSFPRLRVDGRIPREDFRLQSCLRNFTWFGVEGQNLQYQFVKWLHVSKPALRFLHQREELRLVSCANRLLSRYVL